VDRRVRLDIDNGKKKKRGIEDKNMRGGEGSGKRDWRNLILLLALGRPWV